jgi:hypothetical protein
VCIGAIPAHGYWDGWEPKFPRKQLKRPTFLNLAHASCPILPLDEMRLATPKLRPVTSCGPQYCHTRPAPSASAQSSSEVAGPPKAAAPIFGRPSIFARLQTQVRPVDIRGTASIRIASKSCSSPTQIVDRIALCHTRSGRSVTALTSAPCAPLSSRLCRAILRSQEAHAAGAESARGQEQRSREHATRQDPPAAGLSRPLGVATGAKTY